MAHKYIGVKCGSKRNMSQTHDIENSQLSISHVSQVSHTSGMHKDKHDAWSSTQKSISK